MTSLTPETLEAWWARISGEKTPGTANKYFVRLKHLLNTAVRWWYIPVSPANGLQRAREPKGRIAFLSDEQRARIIADANPRLRAYILAARYTAARRANLHELRVKDIDLQRDLIRFPKTKNGQEHTVPLHPELKKALLELGLPTDPNSPVLPRIEANSISQAFRRLVRKLGLPELRFHDLRHDVASSLAMAGANQATIMAVLGHKDPRMSARYTHLADDTASATMLRAL